MDEFDKFAATLKPHPSNAQIFIEVDKGAGGLELANSVLNKAGLDPIKIKVILEESPNWVLIFLSSDDMREAALKLSEAGFTRIMGINPRPLNLKST